MKYIARIWIAILPLLFISKLTFAADTLGIGTPYLPNAIQIIDSPDLITNIVLNNAGTFITTSKSSSKEKLPDDFKAKKIALTSLNKANIWELEFNDAPPLSRTTKFSPEIIRDSILYFKNKYPLKDNAEGENSTKKSLEKIEDISFTSQASGFSVKFKLNELDQEFIDSLSKLPLIDDKTADIFGPELGQTTNLPLYGRFSIKDFEKDSQITLIKNYSFGYPNDQSEIESIVIKKYPDPESRMKALRGGAIAIIVAPSIEEIDDAKSDPTLEIINSPFHNTHYIIPDDINFAASSYDLSHIIVRKSLKPDDNFSKRFQIHGLSKGSL